LSGSILLRPDQGLLAAAIVPVLFFAHNHRAMTERLRAPMLCIVLAALPFVPWTLRNLHTFGVLQPLAPRLANDPGETPSVGFQHWFRTWAVDFTATQDAYWKYPEETVLLSDLPDRAFDSPSERAQVTALLKQTAITHTLDPQVEASFTALAKERTREHPLRSYIALPALRLLNMLTHPRTEMLPIAERWWQFRRHPAQTIFAFVYAAFGVAYFVLAIAGMPRTLRVNRSLALAMAGYVVLRCALLLTLDNPEQRYTLEFFPIAIVLAAALAGNPGMEERSVRLPR
jgi:hypothetical protein